MITRCQVLAAIVAAISVDHGDGFDLSQAGRVQRGDWTSPEPGAPAFAGVSGADVASEHGPVLPEFERTHVVEITAFAPIAGLTMTQRVTAAENAMDRLINALDTARMTSTSALYGVREYRSSGAVYGSVDKIAPGYAIAMVRVTFVVAWRPS